MRQKDCQVAPPSVLRKICSSGHHTFIVATMIVFGLDGSTASPPNGYDGTLEPAVGASTGGVMSVHTPVLVLYFQTAPTEVPSHGMPSYGPLPLLYVTYSMPSAESSPCIGRKPCFGWPGIGSQVAPPSSV
ncbi:hypothetical protein D3C71_1795900 [compost metagenome]